MVIIVECDILAVMGLKQLIAVIHFGIRLNKLTPHIEKHKVNLFAVGQRYII